MMETFEIKEVIEIKEFVPLKSMDNAFGIAKDAEVINFNTGKIVHSYIGTDMYEHIVLCYKGKRYRKRVHRLMAEAFLNNCKVVDHIDGNKSNNVLSNLHAVTHSENIKKAYQENDYTNPHIGRGIWIIAEDKNTLKRYYFKSMRSCERFTGVDRHRIKHFLKGERNNWTKYNFYYDE